MQNEGGGTQFLVSSVPTLLAEKADCVPLPSLARQRKCGWLSASVSLSGKWADWNDSSLIQLLARSHE